MKNKIIFAIMFIAFALSFVLPVFADTKINLQIKTNTQTIYDSEITVTPCDSESDGILKETPYCALAQSGTPSDWTGLWVNSINNIINNDNGNGAYWMWLANLNIDTSPTSPYSLSSKQYILQGNDNILFYYNTNPLDISVDNENPKVGESIKITGKELGLDSSWNPLWNKAIGGKVVINGEEHELNENGEFLFEIINEDSLLIKIKKENFIDSREVTITPEKIRRSSGSRAGSYINTSVIEKSFSVANAILFLSQNQQNDRSYGLPMYTDWVAIAVSAGDNSNLKLSITNYLKSNSINSSILTDNERRAMSLMALGINPYIGTDVNYIKKITDNFDGIQFGDNSLINDDIFALIVLKNAGYTINDEIIIKDINYIISKQFLDGSWGNVDMTSAGIQALRSFENIVLVPESISKAENYLISSQEPDGGFGNSFSTSWALQSLQNNDQILKALKYLTSKQEVDGGMESIDVDINTRIWVTAYVIPAMLHKPWNEILNNFPKEIVLDDSVPTKIEDKKIIEVPKIKNIRKSNFLKISGSLPDDGKAGSTSRNSESLSKNLEEKDISVNPLSVSAIGSNQNNNSGTFFPVIYRILQKIRIPFVWLWVHLGF
ncbi:MAG: prenyltransferase/squalene oxidase repeat-containing protein [Candidatus Paceibacterota bacterium]